MKKSGWVTLAGVSAIMAAGLILLMGVVMVIVSAMAARGALPMPNQGAPAGFLLAIFFVTSAIELLFGAACLASGIGTILRRNWARITMIVIGIVIVVFTLPASGIMLLVPTANDPRVDPGMMRTIKVGMVSFYGLWSAMGLWWAVLLTRAATRAEFGVGAEQTADAGQLSRRPLSISIIAGVLLFSALSFPFTLLLGSPMLLFGYVVRGLAAKLLMTGFFAILLYLGIGLWKLNETARRVAIAYSAFGIVNGAVSILVPGREKVFTEVQRASLERFGMPPPAQTPWTIVYFVTGIAAGLLMVQIYFLITRKAAFVTPALNDAG